jgi:hypothetical protein
MNLSPQQKFERWVLKPITVLRSLDDGDGAFAALSVGCGLFERFIDSGLSKKEIKASPEAFRKAAAHDLGCAEDAMQRFWDGYRLGMQHAFQPKAYVQEKGAGDSWGWEMAEADGFHHYPEIQQIGDHAFLVRIDPWKFINHVLARWKENPELMNELPEFVLGDIAPIEKTKTPPAIGNPDYPPSAWRSYCDPPHSSTTGTGIYPGNSTSS